MERGRRGRGGPPRGRYGGGRGRGRGQEGWETAEEGRHHNAESSVNTQEAFPRQSFESGRLATRPDGGGRVGRPIEVFANFFLLHCGLEAAYHYDIDIKQGGDRRRLDEGDVAPTGQQILPMKLCRSVINECAIQHHWPAGWVFDGKKNVYTTTEMFPRRKSIYPVDMSGGSGRDKIFNVGVQLAATINVLDLNRFLQQGDIEVPRDVLQLLEICLRSSASSRPQCHLSGRSIYFDDPSVNYQLPGGGELWMGYHQGVKLCQEGLMLNVETTCTSFMRRRPVMELFEEVIGSRIGPNFQLEQWMYTKMRNSIVNVMVSPTHRQSRKKHRCIGLTNQSAAEMMFELRDGSASSVAQYWMHNYGRLRFPNLPCLDVSKGRKINYLPPEVCEVVAGQRQDRLSEDQKRETIKFSAQKPGDRKSNILAMLDKADLANDPSVVEFGLGVSSEMTRTVARVLPQPHLEYQVPESVDTGTRGSWNLEGMRFYEPATLKSWAIISCMEPHIALQQGEQGLVTFTQSLTQMLIQMGMTVPNERPPLIHRMQDTVHDALEKAMEDGENQFETPVDFILIILTRKETNPYQEFKRAAEGTLGITTQCIVAHNAGIGRPPRNRMQYLANVAMKINQKLGGVNTQITGGISTAFPVLGQRRSRPFIVFGVDVTHPTGFDETEPSVGAIVASMDPFLGQFAARVLTMPHRAEKMSMKESIKELFVAFYTKNRVKPEGVFFYRDGISEGQFQEIFEHEYNEFLQAFSLLEEEYRPPITIVLVQKRHHTRLFPTSPQSGDHKGNVLPGTVVDTMITSRYGFDFYLNSHSGIQGKNKKKQTIKQ
eukprot:g4397.t1